jgi:hypothetical protein
MGTTPGLQAPAHDRPRWRRRADIAARCALVASTATTAWLAFETLRHRTEPPVAAGPASPPSTAPLGTDVGPCGAPDLPDDAPVGTATADEGDTRVLDGEALIGATASAARHGALATWTDDTLFVSSDDGQHFAPVLPGPGAVRAAAIDCHGRVFALRVVSDPDAEDAASAPVQLLVGVRQGSHEAWRSLDFLTDRAGGGPRLVADGGVVAIAGTVAGDIDDGVLAVSTDGGASWRFDPLDVPGSWEGAAAIDVDRRGVVRVLSRWGDCMTDGSTLTRFDARTGVSTSTAVAAYPRGPSALDGDGWAYGTDYGDALAAWRDESDLRDLTGWRPERPGDDEAEPADDEDGDGADNEVDVVGNGYTVYALWRGELAWLHQGAAYWVAGPVPIERAVALDREGRVLGLTADQDLVRWSPRHGVRHLRGQPYE